jgi:uncharacterized protein
MHHNPAKNVLYVRASVEEIAQRMKLGRSGAELLASAEEKDVRGAAAAADALHRQNGLCGMEQLVRFGLSGSGQGAQSRRTRGGLRCARWTGLGGVEGAGARESTKKRARASRPRPHRRSGQLLHVVAYSDPAAAHREVPGLLEDYSFTALACLDAYEATADLSYFKFAQRDYGCHDRPLLRRDFGGFFDSEPAADGQSLGVLATRRKPLQDSPTPAGNPMAAIALLRLHHYTGDSEYRDKAEQTLETFAGVAEQFGIFAATYGIAVVHLLESAVQVVVIAEDGDEDTAHKLYGAAVAPFAFQKTTLRLAVNQAVAENLPPALAETIPNLPALGSGKSFAVLCSGFACQSPIFDAEELRRALDLALAQP